MTTSEELRNAFRYLFEDELPALKKLVKMLPPEPLVINIGAGAGTSGLAIMESRPDVILATIDIQDSSSPLGCLEAERDVLKAAGFVGNKIVGRHMQICMDSVAVGLEWDNVGSHVFKRRPSMVFIDGDHSYEHARDDIQVWSRIVAPGGIIAVHDYKKGSFIHTANGPHPQAWPGVDRAVDENLRDRYPMILHVDSLIAFKIE